MIFVVALFLDLASFLKAKWVDAESFIAERLFLEGEYSLEILPKTIFS